jgi:hypothetical protein
LIIKELVRMIKTKTINKEKGVIIIREKMKKVISDNEVAELKEVVIEVIEVEEVEEEVTIKEIIKSKNLMKIDQSTKIKKSTRKNLIDKSLMIQTTQ